MTKLSEIQVAAYWIDVPEDLVAVLVEDGWMAECSVHGCFEVAAGRSPMAFEEHVDELVYGEREARLRREAAQEAREV